MLEVTGLQAGYGSSVVLHGLSFEVNDGEFVSILGSNGAGKTTLLKALTGLLPLVDGAVSFAGKRIDGLPTDELVRRGICHVPEGRHVFPQLTVRENLAVGAYSRPSREAARNIDAIFDRLPVLCSLSSRSGGHLSGGEQQLLAIARALVAGPKLLLLDEPTLGLAPKAAQLVERLLRELNGDEGLTILAVEQNVHSALSLADRAVVIESGEIVLQGLAEALWKDEEVIRAYIGV